MPLFLLELAELDASALSVVFTAIFIPLLGLLFALSTPHSRRTPIFILNVISISLGILDGLLSIHLTVRVRRHRCTPVADTAGLQVKVALSPLSTDNLNPIESRCLPPSQTYGTDDHKRRADFVGAFLSSWMTWFTEAILVLRVFIVLRLSYDRLSRIAAILAFTVTVKIVRAVFITLFLASRECGSWRSVRCTSAVGDSWTIRVSWILECFDTA
ncbi:hypothetical protein H0H81_011422 [Sphagnurus paluster]|uniref:Uncharacterized protein n=1 Tax=Sphagnurus paluster TaxID=117069 RepID=A0A9P7KMC5_9AGAR|nr:hypothetical protein H0H81_011422 [Sphagnurus paluster]